MPTKLPNYYEELEVDPRACLEVIKAARGALAKLHHADTRDPETAGGSDGVRMTRINVAYDCLKDASKRAEYDKELALARPRTSAHSGNGGAAKSQSKEQAGPNPAKGPLKCEKCGRTFRSPKGFEWHRVNFTWCATSPAK